jgi:hypothetical protein
VDAADVDAVDQKLPVAIPDLRVGFGKRRNLRFNRSGIEEYLRIGGFHRALPGQPRLPPDGCPDARIKITGTDQQEFSFLRAKSAEDSAFLVAETNGAEPKLLVWHQHR